MAAAVKAVTSGMQKTASTLLIVFVGITLVLFAMLRIYNTGRVIPGRDGLAARRPCSQMGSPPYGLAARRARPGRASGRTAPAPWT